MFMYELDDNPRFRKLKANMHYRWYLFKRDFWRIVNTRFKRIILLDRIPPNANPFHYDLSHMGTILPRGWIVMHEGYDSEEHPYPLNYIIMVNTRTGKQFKIPLPQD